MEGANKLRRISRLLDCCICCQTVTVATMCPKCTQPFCQECIDRWLNFKRTCPFCRLVLTKKKLVKARFIDQISESLREKTPADDDPEQCAEHRQTLLLFCTSCQQCICVLCQFSEDHEAHKDQIDLLENAIEQYQSEIANSTSSIEEQTDELQRMIKKMDQEKQQIEMFVQTGKVLDKNAATMAEILKFREKEATRCGEFKKLTSHNIMQRPNLSEPIHFEFIFPKARQTVATQESLESEAISKGGLEWKLKVFSEAGGRWRFNLCLVQGLPGVYNVAMGSTGAILYRFVLGNWVELVQAYETPREPKYLYNSIDDELIVLLVIR